MARSTEHNPARSISLGNVTIHKKLGEGGFGTVYKAQLGHISRPFAIKFYDPSALHNADNETNLQRFYREAEILFSLRHSNIIGIYGIGEYEGRPYILMECFEGMDLNRARKEFSHSITPERVLTFLERVSDALAYAHGQGIVHRDLKPSNLMAYKGDARILDLE